MSANEPLHETFGIELELVIRFERPEGVEHGSNWKFDLGYVFPQPHLYIIDELRKAGFAMNDYHPDLIDPTKWTVEVDGSIEPYMQEEEYDEDDFDTDLTKYARACVGAELKSPVLPTIPSSLDEVRQMVLAVNRLFDSTINESTGFHVHVGNEQRGFPLPSLKRFATLVAVFENQIEQIHPGHRVGNSWCKPPSSFLTSTTKGGIPLEVAQSSACLVDLLRLMSGLHKAMAYNFGNLAYRRPYKTIEFRQHAGTLDPDQIVSWIRFTTKLVSFSHYVAENRYLRLIEDLANDEAFTVLDLMIEMGEPQLANFYKGKLYNHPPPAPLASREQEMADEPSPSSSSHDILREWRRRLKQIKPGKRPFLGS